MRAFMRAVFVETIRAFQPVRDILVHAALFVTIGTCGRRRPPSRRRPRCESGAPVTKLSAHSAADASSKSTSNDPQRKTS
jgi:hypothetical protein